MRSLAGVFLLILTMCGSGCFALFAGGAAGGGTALWLSGKLVQQVDASMENAVSATRSGLKALNLPINKETLKEDTAQIKSENAEGQTIWIDLHRITEYSTKMEIRVGAVSDKEAAEEILASIKRYL